MSRFASLVGKTVTGDLIPLGVADGNGITALIDKYVAIRTDGTGVVSRGKQEVKLSEMRLLASGTAGGELKGRVCFRA